MSRSGWMRRARGVVIGRSVRSRIVRVLLAVALVPIVALTAFLAATQRPELSAAAEANLVTYAEVEAHAVADLLDHATSNIRVLAANPTFLDPAEKPAEVLAQLQAFDLFTDVTLLDLQGGVIESTSYAYLGRWESDPAFVAARDGEIYRSDPLFEPDIERMVIEVAAPIRRDGGVISIVVGRMDIGRIWDLLDAVRIGATGYVAAFDRHGNVIAHPNRDLLLTKPDGFPVVGPDVGPTTLEFSGPSGSLLVGVSAPVGRNGWRVVAIQDRAETYALATRTERNALLATLVVLVLTAGAAAILSRAVTRPIQALRRTMTGLAAGNSALRAAPAGLEEIDALGDTFNGMADALGLRTAALEAEVAERQRAQERISYEAHHDSLTGLPNRALLKDRLDVALADARRTGDPLAVMFMDLDRFKLVNDSLGHSAGDELLLRVADRILALVREGDSVARVGGDEYVLLLPRVSGPQGAIEVAERITSDFRESWPLLGREFNVSVSIGIAIFPEDGEDAETLLRNADTAMYRAKDDGRDGYQLFSHEMSAAIEDRVALERDLRRAIAAREFVLHFQPQVDAKSRRIVGLEALVRWQHPERGLVPPDRFIPLAEETGLIWELGRWVLRTACTQAQAWRSDGLIEGIPVAVNVSSRQFNDPRFVDEVVQVLGDTGLGAEGLEIEITESVAMRDAEHTVRELARLKDLGVRISIDDFGTGYSSLAYLKKFPVDTVKIDRSFVADVGHDQDDEAIVSAIIALARNLAMGTVAEGVETEDQLTFLRQHDCPTFQGFLYSRAVPPDQAAAMLAGDVQAGPVPADARTEADPASVRPTSVLCVPSGPLESVTVPG